MALVVFQHGFFDGNTLKRLPGILMKTSSKDLSIFKLLVKGKFEATNSAKIIIEVKKIWLTATLFAYASSM